MKRSFQYYVEEKSGENLKETWQRSNPTKDQLKQGIDPVRFQIQTVATPDTPLGSAGSHNISVEGILYSYTWVCRG